MVELVWMVVPIAAWGVLLIVHECGHYLVARWCRIPIKRITIGFGPAIFERTSQKTGTTFRLGLIPFGGFDPHDEHADPDRPVWQRFVTIVAGPATSYLSTVVLAMLLYTCHGVDVPRWYGVGDVLAGYDADGKLEPGDRILEVDHASLVLDSGPSLFERVNAANGAAITLTIERNGQPREVSITPRLDKNDSNQPIWRIGVRPEPQYQVVGLGIRDAVGRAFTYPVAVTRMVGAGLYAIVFGDAEADPGGPRRMGAEFHRAFSAGLLPSIKLLMLLNVYVGLFLLLPLPFFDGGHLVALVYRIAIRRRAKPTS